MNKKIKIFVIASVTLNVLFAGLIGGMALKHMSKPNRDKHRIEVFNKSQIPAQRREFIESQLNNIFGKDPAPRKEMADMREETLKILTSENFDENAYEKQMDKMSDMRIAQNKNMGEEIKNLAKQLNLEERQALAELLPFTPRKHRP